MWRDFYQFKLKNIFAIFLLFEEYLAFEVLNHYLHLFNLSFKNIIAVSCLQ